MGFEDVNSGYLYLLITDWPIFLPVGRRGHHNLHLYRRSASAFAHLEKIRLQTFRRYKKEKASMAPPFHQYLWTSIIQGSR
jgi:hypothetical protein